MRTNRINLLFPVVVVAACGGGRGAGDEPRAAVAAADSIILERTRCYGTCPAYRLAIAADGSVAFRSSYPDGGRIEAGRISPEAFGRLVAEARTGGFFALPDTIARDATLCPAPTSDSPSAILGVFTPSGSQVVVDDRGCAAREGAPAARLAALRALTARVDTVVGVARWVSPATPR